VRPYVLATGGGTLLSEFCRQWVFDNTVSIYLEVPFIALEYRMHSRSYTEYWKSIFTKKNFNDRNSLYRKAHIVVDGVGEPLNKCLSKLKLL